MSEARRPSISAAWGVLALWVPYTALNTRYPGPGLTYALGLVCAVGALGILHRAGVPPHRCGVRLARLSRAGGALLAALAGFVPAALLVGRGQFDGWWAVAVHAPASAVAQELYFRAALLTALPSLCRGRPRWAVPAQALLFALWHARAFCTVPATPAAGALVLLFVGGLLWGWQVQRDRTVLYAAVQHTVFLMIQ